MKERVLQTLRDLRAYALKSGVEITLFYQEEDSYLMRIANSAVSLNTNEHLIRLEITAYEGKKRASYNLITDLDKVGDMKKGVDIAAELVQHAQPLTYQPTVPIFGESYEDESGADDELARMGNHEKLVYYNKAVEGLESNEIRLSGIFSHGLNTMAQINTRSEHTQFFRSSDALVTAVLSHERLKWEVTSEQSVHGKAELDPGIIHRELAFLVECYQKETPLQLPLGSYDIVFGYNAIGDLVNFMNYIAFSGGMMKRGYSFLSEDKIGQKVLSEKFTLADDPEQAQTFPLKRDFMGIPRHRFPIFEKGVFQGFTWSQDDADEFGARPTGHTVNHKSICLQAGDRMVDSLESLVSMPRERDTLYIPFLHYMNIVNPSKGIVTGSSRFGTLLLRKDGTIAIPYNVRITQSLLDIFGEKVAWFSTSMIPTNKSISYGARNPTAMIVPTFMLVKELEISHSNESF